ncbi:hypothetical protein NL676_000250 [Syzygium grande]|nr:hypothetical protein NL676_000250 [Syzygium grande]
MRTRFLNIDYFSVGPPPPPPPSSPAQTLAFLDLPVPHLPSAPPLASGQDLLCFGSLSAIEASLELGRLEIGPALSRFLTDVVPRFVDAGGGEGCGNGSVEKEGELSPEVKERLDCCSTIRTAATEDEFPKENAHLLEEEAVGIFSEVLEIENNEDAPKLGLSVNYTLEAQEVVTKFGDTSIQYLIQPKAVFWEDDTYVAGLSDFPFDTKEILNLLEKDLLEFPSHHCLSKECLESDSVIGATFLEMDFVSIVDRPYLRGNSPCHGPSDRDYISSISPVVLEDFRILDMGTALFCEVFSLQEVHEPEFCNEMLQEKVKFKNFEELVISRELALVDEMFKSLPVPVLPDSVLGTYRATFFPEASRL